jgi:hypothetical protein
VGWTLELFDGSLSTRGHMVERGLTKESALFRAVQDKRAATNSGLSLPRLADIGRRLSRV